MMPEVTVRLPYQASCPLSRRHLQILALAAQGQSDPAIARQLGTQRNTVHTQMQEVRHRLHAANRTAAVVTALKAGWLIFAESTDIQKKREERL